MNPHAVWIADATTHITMYVYANKNVYNKITQDKEMIYLGGVKMKVGNCNVVLRDDIYVCTKYERKFCDGQQVMQV